EIDWTIADDYYLYRHRTSVRVVEGGFEAGPLQLPAGKRHVDEFFGEVETYRGRLAAVLPGTAAGDAGTLVLEVKYQGCADAGVCYPPQTRRLDVALPASGDADPGFASLGRSLAGGAGAAPVLPGTDAAGRAQALPLPPEQAFGFEAIADGGERLLLRFTPARGYYLYRDRSSFRVEGADGIAAGEPRWPAGTAHRDEHFGEVVVYFDQVDVPLPLTRRTPAAATIRLVATFQGCQDEGICYPPMTRSVEVALPAAGPRPDPEATAAAEPAPRPGDAPVAGVQVDHAATSVADGAAAADAPGPASADTAVDASADNAARTRPPAAGLPAGGAIGALVLALLGGLVLNLMPCVLPILSLKVLGVAQSGEGRQRARSH